MTADRYRTQGTQAEFEPSSRGRVLRNKLGLRGAYALQEAESRALEQAQEWAISQFDCGHRFTAQDICQLRRKWLDGIYDWAGAYRNVNISKGDFLFAAAAQVPRLMRDFERTVLKQDTPCAGMDNERLALALARVHAELVLIHPFRDGNGRCARSLALLMALQAGLPTLDFWSFAGRGKRRYFAAVQAALDGNYTPLCGCFTKAINRTYAAFGERP